MTCSPSFLSGPRPSTLFPLLLRKARAFTENFSPSEGALDLRLYQEAEPFKVPEIIAQPCYSQYAVTRDVVQSVPRGEYVRYINWLFNTELDDYLSGRFWEYGF